MRIDFHVHLMDTASWIPAALELAKSFTPDNGFDEVLNDKGEAEPLNYIKHMDRLHIDYSVILASAVSLAYVDRNCRGYERLLPFYTLDPHTTYNPAEALEEAIVRRGYRGLKLYPTYQHYYPHEPFMHPIYAKAQELGIPVLFHTGSSVFPGSRIKFGNPVFFDDIAVDFPELNLVMAHSGRGFWYEEAFFLSKLHPNLYMEISGLPTKKLLQLFPDFEKNGDKIIFGSDWPTSPGPERMMKDFMALPISEEVKQKVLGLNAARILKLI